jgi:hypothetical protein
MSVNLKFRKMQKEKDLKKIKTLEDAFNLTDYKGSRTQKEDETLDEFRYRCLKQVAKAINQGWEPDWSNTSGRKWWPYFRVLPSGSGFSGSGSDYGYGFTYVGSRLCYETEEKSNYAATQFADIYSEFITATK